MFYSGEGLRSVLKGSPAVSPSSSKSGGLDSIIWDEDRDKSKTSKISVEIFLSSCLLESAPSSRRMIVVKRLLYFEFSLNWKNPLSYNLVTANQCHVLTLGQSLLDASNDSNKIYDNPELFGSPEPHLRNEFENKDDEKRIFEAQFTNLSFDLLFEKNDKQWRYHGGGTGRTCPPSNPKVGKNYQRKMA